MVMRSHLARRLVPLLLLGLASGGAAQDLLLAESSTPRRTLRHFLASCRAGDYVAAAEDLALGPERRADGARLARRLELALAQALRIDWDDVPDAPQGDRVTVGALPLPDAPVPLVLARVQGGWRIVSPSAARIDELHALHA